MSKLSPRQIPGVMINNVAPGDGVTVANHETLGQLIHFLSDGPGHGYLSGAYKEITPIASPFPTNIIWYADNTKTQKIIEKIIRRNYINMPITITWNIYDATGTVILNQAIDNINYLNNIFEISRTRTII